MKIKKIVYIISSLIIILSILLWTIFSSNNYYMYGGSTSVNEFMQAVTNIWNKDKSHKKIIYNSMGSQYGVNSVENNTFNIGFISKEVENNTLSKGNEFVDKKYQDKTLIKDGEAIKVKDDSSFSFVEMLNNEKNRFLSLQFAIDKIAIIGNLPNWLNEKLPSINLKEHPNILKKIYEGSLTWEQLAKEEGIKDIPNSSTKIISIARESGSGTRTAFDDLADVKNSKDSSVATSNGMMVQNIKNTPNSIGYVSYGFIQNEIQKKEFTTFEINGVDIKNKDYSFSRPFNMILKAKKSSWNQAKNLVSFLFDHQEIYDKEGLVKDFVLNKIISKG
ncbi:phosphate ABC transporter substrate-binding protein [Spiroplasma endosymbiont of Crioceris asparagi]|uniref:phosphate ABC transporter substrate-binding protein n=1 Tax=Spiroplasma endosymbiont of Crioceris asparagi TaxID=3066286 RepID=UPI0030D11DDA